MDLNKPLAGVPFEVDSIKCKQIADDLRQIRILPESTAWQNEPKLRQFLFKILFVSICHDYNWDVMQAAVFNYIKSIKDPVWFAATKITAKDIAHWLRLADDQKRIRAKERAQLFRQTASALPLLSDCFADAVSSGSEIRVSGEGSLSEALERIPAFSRDPNKKKLNVLFHDLHREKIVHFADFENIEPAVDYHLIRLYLRTGRVWPTNRDVMRALRDGVKVGRPRLVKVLRQCVKDAAALTSLYSGHDVPDLNFIEWQIGRSVCIRDKPHCSGGFSKPIASHLEGLDTTRCVLKGSCLAINDPNYDFLAEPDFKTSFF